MGYWKSKPNRYNEHNFIEIPEGDYRVKIFGVSRETFKTGTVCYEITLKVSGHHGKLWYYLWDNPNFPERKARDFFAFFKSFQIEDKDLKKYKSWKGHEGAVRVTHNYQKEDTFYSYEYEARVDCCLYGEVKDRLPAWSDAPTDNSNLPI